MGEGKAINKLNTMNNKREVYHGKTLEAWKKYSESQSADTPIQVFKYIKILEELAEERGKEIEDLNTRMILPSMSYDNRANLLFEENKLQGETIKDNINQLKAKDKEIEAERINSCKISTEATIRELKLQQEVKRLKEGVKELLRIYEFQISAKDLRELIENK